MRSDAWKIHNKVETLVDRNKGAHTSVCVCVCVCVWIQYLQLCFWKLPLTDNMQREIRKKHTW